MISQTVLYIFENDEKPKKIKIKINKKKILNEINKKLLYYFTI